MNRTPNFKNVSELTHQEVSRKIAVHEAGHATAIHLNNKAINLPPVFFKLCLRI